MAANQTTWDQMAPDPTVPRVLGHFGLESSSLESVGPLVSGVGRHQGYRVRAGGHDWALKPHVTSAVVERLGISHPLELRLAASGFPVAQLHQSDSGQTLVEDNAAHYSLHSWVDGRQVSIADREELLELHPSCARDLASTIGLLHKVSKQLGDGCGGTGADPDRLLKAPRMSARALRRPGRRGVSRWHALRLKRHKSEFDRWIIDVLPEVAAHANLLANQSIAPRLRGSDIGLIHNDINWENLIFDDHFRVRALLDFDNATRAPWVLEVGSAAVVLVGTEPRRVQEFVSTYEAASQIRVDREVFGLAMHVKCVQSILNSMAIYLKGDTDTSLRESWCYHLHESFKRLRRT